MIGMVHSYIIGKVLHTHHECRAGSQHDGNADEFRVHPYNYTT